MLSNINMARAVTSCAVLTAAFGGHFRAAGQPSYVEVPAPSVVQEGNGLPRLSPDGRALVGALPTVFARTAYFFDVESGLFRTRAGSLTTEFLPTAVTDDGFVFGVNAVTFGEDAVARWNPISGAFLESPALPRTLQLQLLDVSADGRVAVGSGLEGAFRLNFGPAGPGPGDFLIYLGRGRSGDEARVVIQRGGGLYDVWGASTTPAEPSRAATRWSLNSIGDGERLPLNNLFDVSEDGTVILHPNFFWRSTGTTPLQALPPFDDIRPRAMSADGRVAVGTSLFASTPSGGTSAVVVWRDGGVPEDVRTLLSQVGINTGSWFSGSGTSISDDGTTVAGTFIASPPGSSPRAFVATIPPRNDGCVNARPVTVGVYTDSTRGATPSVSSSCFADTASGDIWYAFSPVTNEIIRLDTCGSDFNTTLAVYAGSASSCGTSQGPVACNDDSLLCAENNGASRLDFAASIGVTYYIRVSGLGGARGNVKLSILAPNRPVNDSCAGALALDAGFSRLFDTTGATTDPRPGCAGSPLPFFDLWYRTVAPDTGRMTFSTCGGQGNFVIAVYSEAACGDPAARPLDCSGTSGCSGPGGVITVPCTLGQVFYVRVGGAFGAQGGGGRVNAFYSCDSVGSLLPYAANIALAPAAERPLAYYRFEDSGVSTVADTMRNDPSSCGNYPGAAVGLLRLPGVQGSAMRPNVFLDGAGVRNIFAPANLGDATLEAWINTDNPFGGYIFDSREDASQFGLTLSYGVFGENQLAFVVEGPGNFFFGARGAVPLANSQWRHVVGVRRNILAGFGTLYVHQVYVDGEAVLSSPSFGSGSNVETNAAGPWAIGRRAFSPDIFSTFFGSLDEAAIYGRAMSAQTAIDHYLTATGGCAPVIVNRRSIEANLPGQVFAGNSIIVSLDVRSTLPTTYRWDIQYATGISDTLTDGPRPDGSVVSGATTTNLTITGVTRAFWDRAVITGRAITSCGQRTVSIPVSVRGCRCPADFSCDGVTDPDDLSDFIACYFSTPPCPGAEVNGDGAVDPDDLSDFIAAYFQGCP